jgi:DNA-binding CsgD family transcriptional regulator
MLVEQSVVCPILIGRDAPLSTVLHTLDRARNAHGSTLLVSGEAGIGKSRLVRAMVERARSLGFVALQGACFETDRAHPYGPVLDLVRVLSATASPSLAAHYFAPAAAELVTLFPELRSIFTETPARDTVDPQEDRRRLFHSFTEAVHALGRQQPLLLVVEDVHWSDDATLDLVLHLARRIGPQPIALILTFRSDEIGPRLARLLADLDRARCASEISLRPLAVPEVAAMLQAIFGTQVAFGSAFVDGLHELTEGNPFFVEEVLKALLVTGDLERAEGGWRARPLEHVRVPRTATEAVGRRLAGLSAEARRIASVAAVAGRRFDFALLQVLTNHDETELLALVRELVDAQIVVEESADRFAFRHALTREAMRARLLARERVALHRAIATALEQEHDGNNPDIDDSLAYHTFEAGAWDAARRYSQRAADHAWNLCAPREALQHLERAVQSTGKLGQLADPSLLLARGRAHETLGAFQSANEDFLAALAAARESRDAQQEWTALHSLGLLWSARDYDRAGRYRTEALEVARAVDDPALIARSLNRIGNWYVNREDPYAGIPYHDEALAIFERIDDTRGIVETLDLLAMSHHIAGAEAMAVHIYERAIDLFTALENRRGLANALSVLAGSGPSHHSSAGPVRTSIHTEDILTNERPIRIATEIGWRAGEAFTRLLVADCLAWRGEFERALRLARESLAIGQEIEHLEWQCGARRVLGTIALDFCAPNEALSHFETAHAIARQLGSATWTRWTGAPLGVALARLGDPDRAAAILDAVDVTVPSRTDADDAPRTLGERHLALARAEVALAAAVPAEVLHILKERDAASTPRAAVLRGAAFAALERWDEATESLGIARAAAMAQDARPLVWRIDALQGTVHLGERRRLEARRSFDAARALAEELVADLDEPSLLAAFREGLDRLAPPAPEPTPGQAAKATYGGLTRRERDTASLIAQGKSNRAIARILGIGERTVEGYVAAALSKLGFSSRAQIAVWATEQRLVAPDVSAERPRR